MPMHKDKRDSHKVIDITVGPGTAPAFPGIMTDEMKRQQQAAKSGPIKRGKRK